MILNTSACQALCQKLGLKKGLYFFAFEEHLMEKIGVSAEHHKLVWFIAIEVTYKDFTQKKEEYTLI